MTDLILNLKAEYWYEIKAGRKPYEFRSDNDYWRKRLIGREYDRVIFCLGYPKKDDFTRRIVRPYRGYKMQKITHKHFGGDPVSVFAIKVEKK